MRRLTELATPCLLLERSKLARNLELMAGAVRRHGVALRPHMKTAKSAAVARLATAGQAGGITVSTLAEAEYFAREGFRDRQHLLPKGCIRNASAGFRNNEGNLVAASCVEQVEKGSREVTHMWWKPGW